MSCGIKYWIWLQMCLGYASKTESVISYFGDAEQCYNAGFKEWYNSGCFTQAQLNKLNVTPLSATADVISNCDKCKCQIVTPDMESFPNSLKHIESVPLVLYVKGNPNVLNDEMCIAMVGTRNVSSYGAKVADKLAFELCGVGFTVVSGGAIGVDSICHNACLRHDGKTIAVLGCGFGVNYLMKNEDMRNKITKHGALVTEFQPLTPASKFTFPPRNRLISGLSLGTIVVEASQKSGSLITAKFALEQGRDVFAVPGPILDNDFAGTNKLIRDGANFVSEADDVVRFYSMQFPDRLAVKSVRYDNGKVDFTNTKRNGDVQPASGKGSTINDKKVSNKEKKSSKEIVDEVNQVNLYRPQAIESEEIILPDFVSEDAKTVFAQLSDNPIHIDKIATITGLMIQNVMAALTELEIFGCARAHEGQLYTIS